MWSSLYFEGCGSETVGLCWWGVDEEGGRIKELLVRFACGTEVPECTGVVEGVGMMLVEMFTVASKILILKNLAYTSFITSFILLMDKIFLSSLLISSIFSLSIVCIWVSLFLIFMSWSAASCSKIASDSSLIFVATPLFAAHSTRSWRSSSVASFCNAWSRFTAPH